MGDPLNSSAPIMNRDHALLILIIILWQTFIVPSRCGLFLSFRLKLDFLLPCNKVLGFSATEQSQKQFKSLKYYGDSQHRLPSLCVRGMFHNWACRSLVYGFLVAAYKLITPGNLNLQIAA